ncbi:cell division protein ZapE, partial [Cereibacter changlensis]
YEAKVRLIASAADEPERLYIEGSGSFEFARTASRLREMQAADAPGSCRRRRGRRRRPRHR